MKSNSATFVSPKRISILILGLLIGIGTLTPTMAFTARTSTRSGKATPLPTHPHRRIQEWQSSILPPQGLFMSDVPQDDDKNNKKKNNASNRRTLPPRTTVDHWWRLPPPPEDQFVLIGDLLSLTVYGISDHVVCQIMSQHMVPTETHQLVADMVANSEATLHAPVWWDAASPQAGSVLQATMESHFVAQYSPLLEPMGMATTLLAASWLLAGWFHRAFSFQNTLDCTTEKALTVTARTWFSTCLILFGLVVASQALTGMEDWATNFRRGDVDYIVDSLTVLIVWRFMASSLLGGGGGGSK